MIKCCPLELVGRCRQTQFQVGRNLNRITVLYCTNVLILNEAEIIIVIILVIPFILSVGYITECRPEHDTES